jgi:hypothetical protein
MDRSDRVFAPLTRTFDEAFPTLQDVVFEYVMCKYGFPLAPVHSGDDGKRIHRFRGRGGLIVCDNPRCYRGGFELDHEAFGMLRDGITEKELTLYCPGDEGTPKAKRGGHCTYSVKGTLTLVPKQATPQPENPPVPESGTH